MSEAKFRDVDLDDDCVEFGGHVAVPCDSCRRLPMFPREQVQQRDGRATLTGACEYCGGELNVILVGWICSGGGDLSRGGLPDNYTRSGRGPNPGRLPGH